MSERARNRYRALIAIIVALFVSAFSWGSFNSASKYEQEKADKRENAAAHYAEQSENRIFEECLGVSGALDRLACVVEEARAQQSEAYAYYDLEAQQEMAVWTYSLLLVSIGGTFIALVGVAAVTASLWQMRVTNREMARTNEIAHNQLLVSQRPWVSITPEIASDLVFKDGEGRITIRFHLKNYGPSPAVGVDVDAKILPEPFAGWSELKTMHQRAESRPPHKMIGHNIFPNNSFRYEITMGISKENIEQQRQKLGMPGLNMFTSELVACVIYYSPVEKKICMTDLVMWLCRRDPNNPKAALALITDDGITSRSELKLASTFGSGQAH